MTAWYSTRDKQPKPQKGKTPPPAKTRAQKYQERGLSLHFPPVEAAGWMLHCLEAVGRSRPGFNGPEPIAATELKDWATGTETDLGPIDFQHILDASRAFCEAVHEFGDTNDDPPWHPDFTDDEMQSLREFEAKQIERQMGGFTS